MIARIWHGYTTTENTNRYEAVKKREMLPGIGTVRGYGALLSRYDERSAHYEIVMQPTAGTASSGTA
jgi:hypothetical protein